MHFFSSSHFTTSFSAILNSIVLDWSLPLDASTSCVSFISLLVGKRRKRKKRWKVMRNLMGYKKKHWIFRFGNFPPWLGIFLEDFSNFLPPCRVSLMSAPRSSLPTAHTRWTGVINQKSVSLKNASKSEHEIWRRREKIPFRIWIH